MRGSIYVLDRQDVDTGDETSNHVPHKHQGMKPLWGEHKAVRDHRNKTLMKNIMHVGHFQSAVLPELTFSQSRTRVQPTTSRTSNKSRAHILLRQEQMETPLT